MTERINPNAPAYLRLLLLIFPLFFAGCASQIKNTGYLEEGYDSFNVINERNYKLRLNDDFLQTAEPYTPDMATSRPVLFIVAEPQWAAPPAYEDPEREEQILFTIRERFYRYLLRAYPHPTRVRYALREDDPLRKTHHVITLTANVTDYKLGNGFLRYAVGFTLGRTRLQVEGAFYDGNYGDSKIGEYAFRVAHGGYAQNGMNPFVIASDYCLRYAAEEGILNLTELLPGHVPGIEAPARAQDVALRNDSKERKGQGF